MAYLPTSSTLVLSYGLENIVDLISSLVVLWRFYNPGDTEARKLLLKKREKRARYENLGFLQKSLFNEIFG